MINLNSKQKEERIAEIIRGLLSLQESDKNQKKKRVSNWRHGTIAMLALIKLEGGSLVIQHTDSGVLVSMGWPDLWLLFNRGKVKGGPTFTVKECPDRDTLTITKGSTRWLETLIKKHMEFMTKCKT